MRTWAEIDLDVLRQNYENVKKILKPDTKIMASVKANSYGHGYKDCCKALLECGTYAFAVATLYEAKQVRKICCDTPILILSAIDREDMAELLEYDVMPTITDIEGCALLSEAAIKKGKTAKIHIKIDTGMSRIGFLANSEDTITKIIEISKMPNIEIDGIFSHLACADEKDQTYTRMQFAKFMNVIEKLQENGIEIPLKHIANSPAIVMYPEMQLDMVRTGMLLYGYYPSDDVDKERIALKPIMSLKSRISLIKEIDKGVGVSYGKEYITQGKTRIATVPIGYADGYLRQLKNKAKMEIGGRLFNVIGRICMDQCMLDITGADDIKVGDEVIIFGNQITIPDIAMMAGTISQEIMCLISDRVPRIYKEQNKYKKEV